MGFFKKSFYRFVRDQLNLRVDMLRRRAQGDSTAIAILNDNMAWVRLSSSVDVTDGEMLRRMGYSVGTGEGLAKKFVLLGGTLAPDGPKAYRMRSGVYDTNTKTPAVYGDPSIGGYSTEFGLRPMPGILSVQIDSKGAYGGLRIATVSLVCHTREQLNALDVLYMRPGFSLLLEWGHSMYVRNSAPNQLITQPKVLNIFEKNLSKSKLFGEINSVSDVDGPNQIGKAERESGNYDAMYGFVKNFHWTFKDGSYECTLEIVSLGEILDSIGIDYTSNYSPMEILNGFANTFGIPKELPPNVDKAFQNSKLEGLLEYLRYCGYTTQGKNSRYRAVQYQTGRGSTIGLGIYMANIAGPRGNRQYYLKLETLCRFLEECILLDAKREKLYTFRIEPDCIAHYFQMTTNPYICYIRQIVNQSLIPTELEFFERTGEENIFFVQESGGAYNRGNIGNILVNIDYLLDTIAFMRDESGASKRVFIIPFLKKILTDISDVIGGINNFDVTYLEERSEIVIFDRNFDEQYEGIEGVKHTIDPYGETSIVLNFSMESKIFPEQATMIAIAAQTGARSEMGVNTLTYDALSLGLRDRIVPYRGEPTTTPGDGTSVEDAIRERNYQGISGYEQVRQYLDAVRLVASNNQGPDSNNVKKLSDYVVEDTERGLNQMILTEIKLQEDEDKTRSIPNKNQRILPLSVKLTLMGISGIGIGQIFILPEEKLPYAYTAIGKSDSRFRIGFIVRSVSQSIRDNRWTTSIDTVTCLLPKKPDIYRKITASKLPELVRSVRKSNK